MPSRQGVLPESLAAYLNDLQVAGAAAIAPDCETDACTAVATALATAPATAPATHWFRANSYSLAAQLRRYFVAPDPRYPRGSLCRLCCRRGTIRLCPSISPHTCGSMSH